MDSASAPDSFGVPRPLGTVVREAFLPDARKPSYLGARWIFLRALGVFYFSVFFSLTSQVRGLIGDQGILPASELLNEVARRDPSIGRFWTTPTLLWLAPNDHGLIALVLLGVIASLLLVGNVAPRVCLVVCAMMFVSFLSAARDFSWYQSDGMLLEATAAGFVLAPPGSLPRLGALHPPSLAARLLVLWECFRIYFESGVAKIASGDTSWRDMTAMDHYYENGPLPTWIGWWVQQLPHGFHAATAVLTLVIELGLVFGLFAPRRFRLATVAVLTTLQAGIILTANYCFLNYLVLFLAVMAVDDDALRQLSRGRFAAPEPRPATPSRLRFWASAAWIGWIAYSTVAVFVLAGAPEGPSWLGAPAVPLAHLRLADRYGLFARMTNVRYEIELDASADGRTWVPYPFKYKPQSLDEAPRIFAPYQPRFEWNLWFCAIDEEGVPRRRIMQMAYRTCPWMLTVEARLLERAPPVLALFRDDPLHGTPPKYVRATLWQYWMTTPSVLRETGHYWRRERVGTYIDIAEQ